jgi:PKD repeat protein
MKKNLPIFTAGAITLVILLASFFQATGQTVLFTENWETASIGQTPPAGWGIDLVSGNNYTHFLQTGTSPNCYPFNGNRMVEFKSYNALFGVSNRLKQVTPVSTTGYNYVALDFEWFTSSSYFGVNDNVAVQWSTNGTTWSTAATIVRYSSSNLWEYKAVPLPAGAANQPALYIAFLFTSAFGDNCHLDLVHINGYLTAPAPPAATTSAPLYIASQSAYLAGTVNASGNTTNASFQYGTTTAYGSFVPTGNITGTTPVNISGYLGSLLPGHTYHYRTVGTNVGGTTYGSDITFSTPDTLPAVFTRYATNVGPTTATVNGIVYPMGSTTTITFNYGLTPSYGTTVSATPATISGDSLTTLAHAVLTGLLPNTTYHYRITGVNSSGTSHGLDSIFTTTSNMPPTVITTHASLIGTNSATLNGSVNPGGNQTTVTFQYGLTTAYGTTVTFGTIGGNSLTGVGKTVTGLTQGTLYHYRCVGTNANGTTYGNDTVFTTTTLYPPTVTTNPPAFVGSRCAQLSGTFNANGELTTTRFEYDLTTAYGMSVTAANVSGNTPVVREAGIYYLHPGHLYHYRAVGHNVGGTTYGNDVTFTTADTLPDVYTYHATNVGLTSATMNSRVLPNGATTAVSFDWGLTSAYGSTVAGNPSSVPGDSIVAWPFATLTGLTPNTSYHFRVVGTNANGTSYGTDTVFTTTGTLAPTVITNQATSISNHGAWLNAHVNANGTPTNVAFEYGLTIAYGSTINSSTVSGNNFVSVSEPVNGLAPATLYHYRAIGTNANGTTYGNDTTFTTLAGPMPPTVISLSCNYVTASNAVLRGEVNPNGELTTVFFQYGLTSSYGLTANYGTISGNYMHQVDRQVFDLTPSTTYHYRVVGTNAGGTSYGNDITFTTSDSTTCDAQYNFHADSLNPHTIHFTDLSLGNIVFWEWNFGDGSPVSHEQNPTHTYLGSALSHMVCLTVHSVNGTCYDSTCNTVTINPNTNCQAYFSYSPGTAPNHVYQFNDLSTGPPVSWLWNFGDPGSGVQNTSTSQNPVHQFSSQGTYNVCLIIETVNGCISDYCKTVVVQDSVVPRHIFGQVFANGVPIQTGVVNLFSVDTIAPYQPYTDISSIDSSGTYNFYEVPEGDYYINAIPVGVPGYVPTFYGDVLFWEDATIVHLGTPVNPYDIHLSVASAFTPGNGTINGQINTSGLKTTFVDKIHMLIFNMLGQTLAYDVVDQDGKFTFTGLPFGVYLLKAEMAGITSKPFKVILSPDNPSPTVVLTFSGNTIFGIGDDAGSVSSWVVFPNPFTDQVAVSLDLTAGMEIVAEIHDISGRTLVSKSFNLNPGKNKLSLPGSSLAPGIYTLRIYSKNGLNITSKLIKTN